MKSVPQLCLVFMLVLSACVAPIPSGTPTAANTPLNPTATNAPNSTLTGRIVYDSEGDIFVMDLADSSVTRLTTERRK